MHLKIKESKVGESWPIIDFFYKYAVYPMLIMLGWLGRRHIEKSELKEKEQDMKIEALDRRQDLSDVANAARDAHLESIFKYLDRIEKNLDELLKQKK